ncbi:MAG: Z1 domain-containing protein [bacterium]
MAYKIFDSLISEDRRNDTQELIETMSSTVEMLLNRQTNVKQPGMLYGQIQSGKTRAFVGVIAKAFDEDYGVAVVFTKGTNALAKQTLLRLKDEFSEEIKFGDIDVYDIMQVPTPLTNYIINKKLIFVVKKEDDNIKRLIKLFFTTYPKLGEKKSLLIDDEADFASISYNKKDDVLNYGKLAQLISIFRNKSIFSDFIQVTATPYSLFLQPKIINVNQIEYEPMQPEFTKLLPVHEKYIGGKYYFEDSEDVNSPASDLFIPITVDELGRFNKRNAAYFNTIIKTNNLKVFRFSIINYVVGGSIRIIQETKKSDKDKIRRPEHKSAFMLHTGVSKGIHTWQGDLTSALLTMIIQEFKNGPDTLDNVLSDSYNSLSISIKKSNLYLPTFLEVKNKVISAFLNDEISIKIVNSDNDVVALLNENGQLRLDNPYNIFIGGNILDRGLTIDNLIGFFYGRNPYTFQQDTVLQHSRMYGARSKEDIAVSRFYTAPHIYDAMKRMYYFDKALREMIEQNLPTSTVQFIQRSKDGRILPCSPNKVRISDLQLIKPGSRSLPVGFQTIAPSKLKIFTERIDKIIDIKSKKKDEEPYLVDLSVAFEIVELISRSYEYDQKWDNEELVWDISAFKSLISYLDHLNKDATSKGKILLYIRSEREMSRKKYGGTAFSDAPDDGKTDRKICRTASVNTPVLMLLKQNGLEMPNEIGWRNGTFYWPVLIAPQNSPTFVYSAE